MRDIAISDHSKDVVLNILLAFSLVVFGASFFRASDQKTTNPPTHDYRTQTITKIDQSVPKILDEISTQNANIPNPVSDASSNVVQLTTSSTTSSSRTAAPSLVPISPQPIRQVVTVADSLIGAITQPAVPPSGLSIPALPL